MEGGLEGRPLSLIAETGTGDPGWVSPQLQLLSFLIFNMGGLGPIIWEVLGPEGQVLFSAPREELWLFVPLSRTVSHLAAAELFS